MTTRRSDGALTTRRAHRQPWRCMKDATSGGVAAAPSHSPVTISPCAVAQAETGNQFWTAPAATGKSAACAMPSSARARSRPRKSAAPAATDGAATVNALATSVARPIAVSIHRGPMRCPTSAPGI